jgi:hypothetical protein
MGDVHPNKQLALATGEVQGQCVTNDHRRGVGKAAIDQGAQEHGHEVGVCALHDFGVK